MRVNDASRVPRLGLLIAVAVGAWVLAVGDQCELWGPGSPASHSTHALVSSWGGDLSVDVAPPHLGCGASPACPEAFATAVLPRPSTALTALGVVVALAAAAITGVFGVVNVGRRAAAHGRPTPCRSRFVDPVLSFASLIGQRQAVAMCRDGR